MAAASSIIRLFVSSTFADFVTERNVLQRAVFPQLRALCAKRGYRFQPIDLRWGVSEAAGNNKQTLAICLEEIARCQRLSPDLNLLILLGDRYGSCFLPERIAAGLVARLAPHLAPRDKIAFDQAYAEDSNALPPEYVLLRTDGTGDARQAEDPLRQALARAAQVAGCSDQELLPFVASATHLEIQRGLLDAPCDPSAAICAVRSFTSTPEGATAEKWVEQDPNRRAQLGALKVAVEQHLGGHVSHYQMPVETAEQRMDTELSADHQALAKQFYRLLEPRIQEALTRRHAVALTQDPRREANHQFAVARATVVRGRDEALETVKAYLAGVAPMPLLVTGDSGVGKSTLLARAVANATEDFPNAVIVTRYIGVTPSTGSLADFLSGLRREITVRYGQDEPRPLGELPQIVSEVAHQLGTATISGERPLFIFVDALDQLDTAQQVVDWLPPKLAPHLRVVLSLSSDSEDVATLRARLPSQQALHLSPLARAQGLDILHAWLAAERRSLTAEQERVVLDGFAPTPDRGGTPLYLRLAFEQARLWRSFDQQDPLPTTTQALIQKYLAELEKPARHGRELVAHALGNLIAARHGLAEDEVLDVLARDEHVTGSLATLNPGAPKIDPALPLPIALWSRLAADLDPYLTEREADGARLTTFYHQQVRDAADQRYLGGSERALRHAALATYFSEPYQIYGDASAGWNQRKLAELAYQQAGAGPGAREALVTTLTDGRFLEGKLAVEGIAATLTDLAFSADEGDVAKIASVVRAGAVVLAEEPTELLNQIIGRVGGIARLHDPVRHTPTLRLRTQSLTPPNSSQARILQGHADTVHDCALSANGQMALSASADKTLRLWNTVTGECVRIFTGHEDAVLHCALSGDGRRALSVEGGVVGRTPHDTKVRVWDTTTGECLHVLDCHSDNVFVLEGLSDKVTACALSLDGRVALTASADKTLRVWDATTGRCLNVLQGHTGQVYGCALSADGRLALSSGADSVRIWDTHTGQSTRDWSLSAKMFSGHSCALSADGQIALSNWHDPLPLRSNQESAIYYWNIPSGQLPRLLWTDARHVRGCALSADGHFALLASEDQTLRLLDTSTGQCLRVFEGHTGWVNRCALSVDARVALSASSDHTLRVWDITVSTPPIDQSAGMRKTRDKRVQHCALSADGSVAVSVSTDTGMHNEDALRRWNPATGELLQTFQGEFAKSAHCALSADGRLVFSDSVRLLNTAPVRTWDTASGRVLRVFKHYTGEVGGCALSADGRLALFAAEENPWRGLFHILVSSTSSPNNSRFLYLWDTITGRIVRRIKIPGSQVHDCALSADGSLALTAHPSDRKVLVWDIARGQVLQELKGHTNLVYHCALNANGTLALSASWDRTVRLWDTATGKCLHVLRGHSHWVSDCTLSADGCLAASVSAEDRTLRIWGTSSGQEICRFTHDGELRSCALNANGSMVMIGDGSNSVHFLDLQGFECASPVTPTLSWLAEREHREARPRQRKRGS